jgi:hypothetical protein
LAKGCSGTHSPSIPPSNLDRRFSRNRLCARGLLPDRTARGDQTALKPESVAPRAGTDKNNYLEFKSCHSVLTGWNRTLQNIACKAIFSEVDCFLSYSLEAWNNYLHADARSGHSSGDVADRIFGLPGWIWICI